MSAAVFGAFFVSGMSGLIQQVAWTRLLRHVMGNDTFAIATVLCAFMGGLALGSFLGGRFIDRRRDPLRVFGALEASIGLYCFGLPWLIDAVEPVYRLIYQNTHTSFYTFSLIRFLFCGVLILIPATFMGATLPVLTRFFVRSLDRVGWSVGSLYALNTLGAVLGAMLSGFFFIRALGVSATIYLACTLNVLVGITGYLLFRRTLSWPAAGYDPAPPAAAPPPAVTYGSRTLSALLVCYGLAGCAALIYEVTWTRVLSLLFVSSVYAFSMMLTAFILGLALGAMAIVRFVDRLRDPMHVLGVVEIAIGLSALLVVPFFGRLPIQVTGVIARFGGSFWMLHLAEFGLIMVIMLVPTTLMGAAFPIATRLFVRDADEAGSSVGEVYAANTVGAIVGAFLGGFVLIPWIGIQRSIFAAVTINVLTGVALVCLGRLDPWRRVAVASGAVVIATVGMTAIPPWDASRMSFGPAVRALQLDAEVARSAEALEALAQRDEILFHKEGLSATVSVREQPDGVRTLLVNGIHEASSTHSPQQALLAHIPLLLHPDPRSALVIGLASGMTLGSAARHDLERLVCVEISPAVVDATRFFDEHNYHVLDDPRVTMVITDGRNHLALSDDTYDVIISQPSNPWIAGVADLFTREFFELCRARLNPGGTIAVWFQTSNVDYETFRSVVATFRSVFPNMTIWKAARAEFLLVGARDDWSVGLDVVEARVADPGIAADLARIGIASTPEFLAGLVMGPDGAARMSEGARIHTDDNALLEFAAPRTAGTIGGYAERTAAVERFRAAELPFLAAPPDDGARLEALRALAARFIAARGHVVQASIASAEGRDAAALEELKKAAELNADDGWLRIVIGEQRAVARAMIAQGQPDAAISIDETLLEINPHDARVRQDLGAALAVTGQPGRALEHLLAAAELMPDWAAPRNGAAWILATHPDPAVRNGGRAVDLAERAVALTGSSDAQVLDTLAAAYAEAGRFDEATATAEAALELAADRPVLAAVIERRLSLYRAGTPYHEAP